MAITHKYTLVCDDIRQENTGKFILVGLYTGQIGIPHVPLTLPSLSFFQVFECDRPGNFSFRIRLDHMETGQHVLEGMGMINVLKPGVGVAPVRFGPLPVPAFGTYSLVVTVENEPPIIFHFDFIMAQPSVGPAAGQLPMQR
jgi:hypothetical protein